MDIQANYPLAKCTTFRIGGPALYFAKTANLDELKSALKFAREKRLGVLVFGGGSNVLVSDRGFAGLAIEIDFKGISKIADEPDFVRLKVGSGEIWDEVVEYAVKNDFWGIENLSAIPGKTGAVPVQNVGAYGQEGSEVIDSVEVFDLQTLEVKNISADECGFGYRRSHFNTDWKNRFAIISVNFRLSKNAGPNLGYADVKKYFEQRNNSNPGLLEIRDAIIEIRKNKFPDLSKIGTAGSFFENLVLSNEDYEVLEQHVQDNFSSEAGKKLAEIKNKFPAKDGIKIPSAFLIDICGLKEVALGGARLWEKQALVIVNTGKATASDVASLFHLIRQTVFKKTGMMLASEPEFIGFSQQELNEYFSLT